MDQGTENPNPSISGNKESSAEVDAEWARLEGIRNSKKKCLLVLLGTYFVWGFLTGLLPEDSTFLLFLDYAGPLFSVLIILACCHLDAEERNFRISRRFSIALFLILFIAFPYYISITRKGIDILVTLIQAAAFIILTFIIYFAACLSGIPFYNWMYS